MSHPDDPSPAIPWWAALVLACAGGLALYGGAGFVAWRLDAPCRALAARAAARAELRAGQTLSDRLKYPDALAHFDRALELDPELADGYQARGACRLKLGTFVPGILDLSRSLELDPRRADPFFNRIFRGCSVDPDRVIDALDGVVAEQPDAAHVLFMRGLYQLARTEYRQFGPGELDRGAADFTRTLELDPGHVAALLCRGLLSYKRARLLPAANAQGRQAAFDSALADYAAALRLDPRSGMGHHLQALCWSVLSAEAGLTDEQRLERRRCSLAELGSSLAFGFEGLVRFENESGFDAVRDDPVFVELTRTTRR